jgi:hypothetical protein
MKNKKWVTYLFGTILTLIALAAVGIAGFRAGIMRSAAFPGMGIGERPSFNQNVDNGDPRLQQANPGEKDDLGGNPRGNGFNPRSFDRGNRGMPIMGGFFGLIHIALLAAALWFGYKLVQKSGWRLVRVQNDLYPSEPVNAESGGKKESG